MLTIVYPKFDRKCCYYQEFWKVYLLNEILISKVKDFSGVNKQLHADIDDVEVQLPIYTGIAKGVDAYLGSQDQEEGSAYERHD